MSIKTEIENAYKLLSAIPVSGDAVDVSAACRAALRNAYQEAKKLEDPEPEKPEEE